MYTFVLINIFLSFNGMDRRNIFGFVLVWVSFLVLCARRGWRCCVCVLVTSFVEGRPILLEDGFMIKDAFRGTHPSTVSF
jgi:hypothetical protein